jgi:hypothetical protein
MKDLTQIRIALSKLKIVDLNSLDAYLSIQNIIRKDIEQFLLPRKIFEPGLKLYRSRNNQDGLFQTIDDLSNRMGLENITEFGRANEPNQSIFYAADVRITAISETNEIFREENCRNTDISITTSQWVTIKDLDLTLIVGNSIAKEKNDLIKSYAIDIMSLVNDICGNDSDKVFEILSFISEEFAFNARNNHNNYKISCAFAQLIYENSDGLLYPSLQREFEGLNFAIKPESVKEKLRFVCAVHDKFRKMGSNNYKHVETTKTITENRLIWGTPEEIVS